MKSNVVLSVYLAGGDIFSLALCGLLISGLGAERRLPKCSVMGWCSAISISISIRKRFTGALCSQGNKSVRWVIEMYYWLVMHKAGLLQGNSCTWSSSAWVLEKKRKFRTLPRPPVISRQRCAAIISHRETTSKAWPLLWQSPSPAPGSSGLSLYLLLKWPPLGFHPHLRITVVFFQ